MGWPSVVFMVSLLGVGGSCLRLRLRSGWWRYRRRRRPRYHHPSPSQKEKSEPPSSNPIPNTLDSKLECKVHIPIPRRGPNPPHIHRQLPHIQLRVPGAKALAHPVYQIPLRMHQHVVVELLDQDCRGQCF